MRVLFYFNLLAIVIISGALAQMYQGAPLPWVKGGVLAAYFDQSGAQVEIKPAAPKSAPEAAPEPAEIPLEEPPAEANAAVTPVARPDTSQPVMPAIPTEAAPTETVTTKPLRVLTEGAYPPFNGRNATGALSGYDIDMVREICARLERSCKIETRGWKALLPALKSGEADLVVASMLIPAGDERGVKAGKEIVFSDAYYKTPGHFAGRRDVGALSAASLATQTIAVQTGSTHEAYLKSRFSGAKLLSVPTLDEAEAALIDGKAGLVFGDRNALLNWMKRSGGDGCCRMVGGDYDDPAYFGAGAGIALRAGDTKLREDVNKAIAGIGQDGTELKIARPYFGQTIR
ncbi:MAG: transporter substrate-binding domain-containing protein [Parvibaculaceae bacterium]